MISEQADENAIIIWGAALDEEMEDAISVIVIATGFPTTDSYSPVSGKKDEKKPVSPFQYGAVQNRPDPTRFGTVTRPQDKPQQKPANPYQPSYQQPSYSQNAAPSQSQPQQPQAPVYPNANTSLPTQKPAQQSRQSSKNNDSDDSFMDIMSILNNK